MFGIEPAFEDPEVQRRQLVDEVHHGTVAELLHLTEPLVRGAALSPGYVLHRRASRVLALAKRLTAVYAAGLNTALEVQATVVGPRQVALSFIAMPPLHPRGTKAVLLEGTWDSLAPWEDLLASPRVESDTIHVIRELLTTATQVTLKGYLNEGKRRYTELDGAPPKRRA